MINFTFGLLGFCFVANLTLIIVGFRLLMSLRANHETAIALYQSMREITDDINVRVEQLEEKTNCHGTNPSSRDHQ